jgi:hypothetical protein
MLFRRFSLLLEQVPCALNERKLDWHDRLEHRLPLSVTRDRNLAHNLGACREKALTISRGFSASQEQRQSARPSHQRSSALVSSVFVARSYLAE